MENIAPDMVVSPDYRLTSREKDVLTMAAEGLNRRQIADRLGLRSLTVSSHLKSIYRKLGVHNRSAAVAIFLRQGLVNDPAQAKSPVFRTERKHLGLLSPPGLNACPHCGTHFSGSILPDPILGV